MRSKNIGMVAAVAVVSFGAAACGSSGKTSGAAAAGATSASAPASADVTSDPTTDPTTPEPDPTSSGPAPLLSSQLQQGLLAPSAFGSGGYTRLDGYPKTSDEQVGSASGISDEDCDRVALLSVEIGSVDQVKDDLMPKSAAYIVHQHAYQFAPGDAAVMMNGVLQKLGECKTYDDTNPVNNVTNHVKAQVESVSGLGDQAIKIILSETSQKYGPDTEVELDVRYGDVVIGVSFDATTAGQAKAYDLAGKVKAIAAKLNLKATGS